MPSPIKPNARSAQTREALLTAALEVFGRDGFHAASTRAIADAAGVNQALIAYHFGSKEGLYLAAFETIADNLARHVGPVLEVMRGEIDALDGATQEGRRAALAYIDRLLGAAAGMFSQPQARRWVRLVLRELQDPGEAFDIFYRGTYGDMLETFTRLVATLTGHPPEDERTRIVMLTILGQLMVFFAGRATSLRHMGWEEIGAVELQKVHEQIRQGLYARFDEVPL